MGKDLGGQGFLCFKLRKMKYFDYVHSEHVLSTTDQSRRISSLFFFKDDKQIILYPLQKFENLQESNLGTCF
jgi:hypothetical protein